MASSDVPQKVEDRRLRMRFFGWLFRREMRLFRVIVFVYLFIFVLSLLGLFWEFMVPGLDRLLAASMETPWGIFTSLFMHADLLHLAANMSVLALYLFYFVLTNFYNSWVEIKRRVILASLLVFVSAIFSNLLWIFLFPNEKAIGSSGLVYAFIGITFGLALGNILVIALSSDDVVEDWATAAEFLSQEHVRKFLLRAKVASYFFNGLFLAYFLFVFFSSPEQFLNVGPQVNSFVHASSFEMGFVVALVYSFWVLFGLLRR